MTVSWDYTTLAKSYLKRPDYAPEAIDRLITLVGLRAGDSACDVGAGVGHLTRMLAERELRVLAVEPNAAMRTLGEQQLRRHANVRWAVGTGEATGQPDGAFHLVSFGSSFNVADRAQALVETHRILRRGGWFCCLWNHRDLDDPIQAEIERIIGQHVPEYAYGSRREDQSAIIEASRLFGAVRFIEAAITHRMDRAGVVEAWRSHATLARQARDKFDTVVDAIDHYLAGLGREQIDIPYVTRMWAARRRD
ncbi:MAG: methyltransferase domain-containing protein [Alphaproteobacteria bacterium]|nr:methyltransferase domain-containing protein [Alphaproteobacteria bacterium]